MKKVIFLSWLLLCSNHAQAAAKAKLWASVSINKPVFYEEMTREAEFTFTLENQDKRPALVDWRSSRLFLNKQEIQGWSEEMQMFRRFRKVGADSADSGQWTSSPVEYEKPISLSPGVTTFEEKRLQTLATGEQLTIIGNLARYFERPGTYTVQWTGKDFKARPVTFEVLPWKDKVPDEVLLVRQIRQKLPNGWHVFYDGPRSKWITVEHDPVRSPDAYEPLVGGAEIFSFGGGPFGSSPPIPHSQLPSIRANPQTAPAFGRKDLIESDIGSDPAKFRLKKGVGSGTYRPFFAFGVKPFLAPAEWQKRKETNLRITKILNEISSKLPNFGRQKGEYQPKTPEDEKQFALYKQLSQAKFDLPRFYYRQIGVDYEWPRYFGSQGGNFDPLPAFPETEKAEEERNQLVEMVESLLTPYEPNKIAAKDEIGQP